MSKYQINREYFRQYLNTRNKMCNQPGIQISVNSSIIGELYTAEESDCILHQERKSILACLKVPGRCTGYPAHPPHRSGREGLPHPVPRF